MEKVGKGKIESIVGKALFTCSSEGNMRYYHYSLALIP